jgi:hypothetical protein
LLGQAMGGGILDIQRAASLRGSFPGPHGVYCKAIPRDIPEPRTGGTRWAAPEPAVAIVQVAALPSRERLSTARRAPFPP